MQHSRVDEKGAASVRPLPQHCVLQGVRGNDDQKSLWQKDQEASVFDRRSEERVTLRLTPGSLIIP